MVRAGLVVSIVAVLGLLSVGAAQDPIFEGDPGRALDASVQRATGGAFWGVVLVAKDGKPLLAKGYGFADYGERPNTPDTLFENASASKSFTAAAILRLRMGKKLDLDDPLSKFFRKAPRDNRAITLRPLLSHTSGISGSVGVPYASPMTRRQFVDYARGRRTVTAPRASGNPGPTRGPGWSFASWRRYLQRRTRRPR